MKEISRSVRRHGDVWKYYRGVEMLGRGSFGLVYLAQDEVNNRRVAIKVVELANLQSKLLVGTLNELKLMQKEAHDNLLGSYDSVMITTDAAKPKLALVMELMDRGSLTEIIAAYDAPIPEPVIAYVCRCVASGLQYLHARGVVHRDIKSDNVLANRKGCVKLSDFGFCALASGNHRRRSIVGSTYWISPEVSLGREYDQKADIWSLGIFCMELLEGDPPYYHLRPHEVAHVIATVGRPKLQNPHLVSPTLQDFLDACLNTDPRSRASSAELLKVRMPG